MTVRASWFVQYTCVASTAIAHAPVSSDASVTGILPSTLPPALGPAGPPPPHALLATAIANSTADDTPETRPVVRPSNLQLMRGS
jgi:hypothetical protein